MNLVGNAVKFTEAGTIVIDASVALLNEKSSLIIDIEDTGRGFDAVKSQSLFQAFEQADNTVSRRHGGTGLGLAISRRLAKLMGGDVTLLRTELGKGSCFRLQLPLYPMDGSVLVNTIVPKDDPAGQIKLGNVSVQGRILLAEDGLDNQRLISFLLTKAGAVVDIADNGQIALEMLNKASESQLPYDLLLTDMQMPVMDGYMLARAVRNRGVKIPIVALTAHMAGAQSWHKLNKENRFSLNAHSKSDMGISKGLGPPPPALLTRIEILPSCESASSTTRSRSSSLVTSHFAAIARTPSFRHSLATSSASSTFRSVQTMSAPHSANIRQMALPIPLPPPVTNAH